MGSTAILVSHAKLLHVVPGSKGWPKILDTIDDPPAELWLAGETRWLESERTVAIVGTRSPTPYGEAQAERFAGVLARQSVVIVSGLARGIDSSAHRATLEADGGTIAVLGSGVDQPWPASPLAEEVGRKGLFVSEFPPGSGPRRHHFPRRNRILSGLTQAVLVVEAAWASGSLITARWAVDQGREVFALPGRVDHPMSRGTHRLLREGAHLVESPEELMAELGWMELEERKEPSSPASPVASALVGETLTASEIARRLGVPVGDVLVELVRLELDGRAVRAPGGLYRLSLR